MAARLRGKGRVLVTVEMREIFLSSLYIFMFNSYFIFYNRGTSAKGLGDHRDAAALNPVTLSYGGSEVVSPTQGLERTSPPPPQGC